MGPTGTTGLVELADQNGNAVVWPHVVGPLMGWVRLLEVTVIAFGVVIVLLLAALTTALIWSLRG